MYQNIYQSIIETNLFLTALQYQIYGREHIVESQVRIAAIRIFKYFDKNPLLTNWHTNPFKITEQTEVKFEQDLFFNLFSFIHSHFDWLLDNIDFLESHTYS